MFSNGRPNILPPRSLLSYVMMSDLKQGAACKPTRHHRLDSGWLRSIRG
jgi:hypothetical protein